MLPELVKALLEPKAYPEATGKVKLVQTQMSFVFLTDEFVYKVKKAVNLGYLDYTTQEKRRFYCQREVELNRRLCPEVYLGVVPITRNRGVISVAGRGEVIEHAVKMRRLPQEAMMDVLLANSRVSPEIVTRVAQKLAAFHQQAETSANISAFGDIKAITQNTDENFAQTEKYISTTIPRDKYQHIKDYTDSFIQKNTPLFGKRIARGRIRDCHGDLHAAHICFTNDICIYDCIEFNDRFRYCDVASEIAFLAMDLDHYGRADLSRGLVNAYVAESRDRELAELLGFYKCYRAYVRGKVESFKLDDPYIAPAEKRQTLEIASSYFDLAHAYTRSRPVLFITTGLVGTGKTFLAQALAKRLGLVVISSDVTRKQLASIPITEHRFEAFDSGIYSPEFSRKTYDKMFSEAKHILSDGGSVILDASFIKAGERLKAKRLAEEMGADFFIIECTLDEESIRKRLARRREQETTSDGRWEIYQPQKRAFAPVVEATPQKHAIIDTSKPVEKTIRQVLDMVNEGAQIINNQEKILRVPASLEEIKKSYGILSRFYAILEGIFERGLRERGLQLLDAREGERVLEIGFGTGFSLAEIAKAVGEKGKAYGLDITPQMVEITRERIEKKGLTNRVELHKGDARGMPYQDSKFDAVYMASTLELFDTPDIPRVLQEVKRVLKPSGRLVVASLTKEGRESSLFITFYEWLHQKIPKYASCRPIYAEKLVKNAGYEIIKCDEFVIAKLVPWKIVVARPLTEQTRK